MLPPPHSASNHPPSPSQYRAAQTKGPHRAQLRHNQEEEGQGGLVKMDQSPHLCGQRRSVRMYQTGQTDKETGEGRGRATARDPTARLPPIAQHQDGVPGPGGYQGASSQAGTWMIRKGRVLACPPQFPQSPASSTQHLRGTMHSSDWLLGTARPGSSLWLTAPAGSASREGTALRHPPTSPLTWSCSRCPPYDPARFHWWLLSLDTAVGTLAMASLPSISVLLLCQTLFCDALGCELSQDVVQVVDVRVTVTGEVGAKLCLVVDLIPYHCV